MGKVIEFPATPDEGSHASAAGRKPEDVDFVTSLDIVAGAQVTYRQVDFWTRTGLLVPTNDNPGQGNSRHYAPEQLARAKAISALLRAGLALPSIRKHLDTVLDVGALTYGPVTITYTPEEDPA